jgi:hypothetical protein
MQALCLHAFTRQVALEIQSQVVNLLRAVSDQYQILLDPEVLWHDDVVACPTLGETWRHLVLAAAKAARDYHRPRSHRCLVRNHLGPCTHSRQACRGVAKVWPITGSHNARA